MTKHELLERVWQGQFVEEGNLTVHIAAIRKALGEKKGGNRFVATVPGRGYQFVADVISPDNGLVIEEHSLSRITMEHEEDDLQAVRAGLPQAHTSASKLLRRKTGILIAGLVTALIAGLLIYRFGGSPFFGRGGAAERTTRQLTGNGNVSAAAMSPDGKYFVYRDNDRGLWYGSTAGGSVIQIQPASDTTYDGLTFGPSGNELYYVAGGRLMKMPVLGGPAQPTLQPVSAGFAFSPDGKRIAFIRNDRELKTSSLIVKDFDGTEREAAKVPSIDAFTDYPPGHLTGQSWLSVLKTAPDRISTS